MSKKREKKARTYPIVKTNKKEKIRLKYNIIKMLAMTGATEAEIAEIIGMSLSGLRQRKEKDYKLQAALEEGAAVPNRKVVQSLYRRALGYDYNEIKEKIFYDKYLNPVKLPVEITRKHLPGDVKAMLAWLYNRTEEWKDTKTLKLQGELSLRDRADIAAKAL